MVYPCQIRRVLAGEAAVVQPRKRRDSSSVPSLKCRISAAEYLQVWIVTFSPGYSPAVSLPRCADETANPILPRSQARGMAAAARLVPAAEDLHRLQRLVPSPAAARADAFAQRSVKRCAFAQLIVKPGRAGGRGRRGPRRHCALDPAEDAARELVYRGADPLRPARPGAEDRPPLRRGRDDAELRPGCARGVRPEKAGGVRGGAEEKGGWERGCARRGERRGRHGAAARGGLGSAETGRARFARRGRLPHDPARPPARSTAR